MSKTADFSHRLSVALDHAGISTKPVARKDWLASVCDITPRHAGNYLNGEKLPTTEGVIFLATKLGVSLEWLATGRGPMLPLDITDEQADTLSRLSQAERERLFGIAHLIHSPLPNAA